ncbi:hypothetical protein [Micromonospora sp. NPDC048830]|uniref:hypothetical protein n=1 Tax=Micromonospora sp. NPDC048830 TaxID=3364257 RepID=UPI0037138082
MAGTRLVPRDTVSFEDFSRFADARGWTTDRRSVRAARRDESPEFLWHGGSQGTVRLVHSSTLGRCYLVLTGDEPDTLAALVRDEFPTFTEADIIARLSAARTDDDRIAAFRLVAAAGIPTYDPTIYETVRAGLQDADPLVLLAAMAAAFHLRWRQFEPLVEGVRRSPTAGENIRVVAGDLLGLTLWDRG